MRTRKPTVAELRDKRERQEKANAERAHARANVKRARRSAGLEPEAPFHVKTWRGLALPHVVKGRKKAPDDAVVVFRPSFRDQPKGRKNDRAMVSAKREAKRMLRAEHDITSGRQYRKLRKRLRRQRAKSQRVKAEAAA